MTTFFNWPDLVKVPGRLSSLWLILCLLCPLISLGQDAGAVRPTDTTPLKLNEPIERSISSGEIDRFQIVLRPNTYVKVMIEQRGIDVSTTLYGPDEKYIANFEAELQKDKPDSMHFVSGPEGAYRINVNGKYKGFAGRYEIRLVEMREATEPDRVRQEATVLLQKSKALSESGKFDEALPSALRAVEIVEKTFGPESEILGSALREFGFIQRSLGQLKAAETTLQRAIAINEKAFGPNHPATIETIGTLGLVYRSTGDNEKAERFLERSLELREKTLGPEHPSLIQDLINLSSFYLDRPDYLRAERVLLRGIAIAERVLPPDAFQVASMLNNLGQLYRYTGRTELGEPLLERALAIYEKTVGTETNFYSNTLQNLGIYARERKDYTRALQLYEQALKIREKILGKNHINVALLLNNISNVYKSMGDYPRALEIQLRVLDIANASAGPYGGVTFLSTGNIARIYAAQGDAANTVKYQKLHDERLETLVPLQMSIGSVRQRQAYFDALAERTDRTISFHANLAPDDGAAAELAAEVILQRKGRILDAMAESMARFRERAEPKDQKLFDQLNAKTSELAKFVVNRPPKISSEDFLTRINALESEKEKIEFDIGSRYSQFRSNSVPVTLAAVRGQIPADAALIEFAVYRPFDPRAENNDASGEPHYIAYVIGRGGAVKWKNLGPAKEIEKVLEDFRRALNDPKSSDFQKVARMADEKVMRPLRGLIGGAKHVLISPDGLLNLIPFEAFVDEKGKYLVENLSITYLTSGRDLLRMGSAKSNANDPLIIAGPAFGDGGTAQIPVSLVSTKPVDSIAAKRSVTTASEVSETYFAPIGGTDVEALAIKNFFPNAQYLTGTQATETALKTMSSPSVLHIATHGFYLQARGDAEKSKTAAAQSDNPLLRSGLAFAGANVRAEKAGDDGIMTALEASGLNLWGTKLVVLSACGTGLGEVRNGDGVYGLRRSFVLAGAESLLMSMWPVSDYVTRELMTNYYKNLKQGLGRGESLRRVQLEMLKRPNRRHPFYWASFIQSGEWANLDGKR